MKITMATDGLTNGTGPADCQLHLPVTRSMDESTPLTPPLLFRLVTLVVVCLLVGGLVISTASASIQSNDYSVSWYTFDGGGDVSTGGDYTVMGTIGQPDAGQHSRHSTYNLTGGFWAWVARYLDYLPLIEKP